MKKLELNQMEIIEGGSWWHAAGLTCGLVVMAGVAITVGTGGAGALVAGSLGMWGCGVSLGFATS